MDALLTTFVMSMLGMLMLFVIIFRTCQPIITTAAVLAATFTMTASLVNQIGNDADAWPWCPCGGTFSWQAILVTLAGISWNCMGLWTVQKYGPATLTSSTTASSDEVTVASNSDSESDDEEDEYGVLTVKMQ